MGPITYTFENLKKRKAELEGTPLYKRCLQDLRTRADEIISLPVAVVTDCPFTPVSGNKHDYITIGCYWWPNPDTPDGLPWIGKDGFVNPNNRNDQNFELVAPRVHILALAAFYLGEQKYIDYAVKQVYDWFLNPETCMNPHARYAQSVPGVADGRLYGIMDFHVTPHMLNGIGILKEMGVISEEIIAGVKDWYVQFTDWLLTDEMAIHAGLQESNHGSWYDSTILSSAYFTDRPKLAEKIYTTAYDNRIKKQIRPDGTQPIELGRVNGLSYSCFNLEALTVIATIAQRCGYTRFWETDSERGVCIMKQALDFLYPFTLDMSTFPYRERLPGEAFTQMVPLLRHMDLHFPGEGYYDKALSVLEKADNCPGCPDICPLTMMLTAVN